MHTPTRLPPADAHEWSWLQPGVDEADVLTMFEEVYLFSTTFAWFTLSGQEAVRVRSRERAETLHLRLATRLERPGRLRLALHIARDEETLAAWREGLLGETEIIMTALWRSELSRAEVADWVRLGRERCELFPRVTVGIGRQMPSASEWHVAGRALEAFNLFHEPLFGSIEGPQRRTLVSGEEVELEILPREFHAIPVNDGSAADTYPKGSEGSDFWDLHWGAMT